MPMSPAMRWGGVFASIAFFIYLFHGIMAPFVIAIILSYALNPLVLSIVKWRVPRALAAGLIVLLFIGAITLLVSALIPMIQMEVLSFIKKTPELAHRLLAFVNPIIQKLSEYLSPEDIGRFKAALNDSLDSTLLLAARLIGNILASGFAIANLISLIIITPVVSFYMLKDWDRIVAKAAQLIPERQQKVTLHLAEKIDNTMAGFARGQAIVCAVMALFYSAGLTFVGLDFSLIIGISTGLLTCIPYVGFAMGILAALIVAITQFSTWIHFAMVLIVFATGLVMEGYYLTPKLVGDRIGLHPIWIIFAVLGGGHLQGMTGILIALPFASIVGIFVRFAIERYKESSLYHGFTTFTPKKR